MGASAVPRPVIAIPASTAPEPWYSPSFTLPVSYLRAVEAAGAVPLLIQPTADLEILESLYSRCDGLLLAGGEDIHPSNYGAAPHPKLELTNTQRDAAELWLARRALAEGMPIFGICRGIQLLNVAMGGTLYQDLAAERPGPIDHAAGDACRDFRLLSHPIELAADSWTAELLGTASLAVNSLHHQAIRDVAPGLRAVGYAPDGLIEAVEGAGSGFIAAVQSHPELIWQDADPRWAQVFAGFVAQLR
ncbi:MAG: gamma-glutamyl-gamma-aminobutyrate hydrolase family protein [Roseiflexaceae bacterium]|nr:gamma-glutamyl-gamma-aminobutyrate hydrolase family protein [Roseiflexaceae bacterium]